MKIGIVSDGAFGERAFENIRQQFPCEWILVPYSASPIMDDVELDLPACDLFISYARHPDVILALVEHKIPVVLGITPGPGLVRQAKEINSAVAAPPTMCSLEPMTGCKEIDLYAERFGLPGFQTSIENGMIAGMEIIREAPCGSTRGAAADCTGMPLCTGTLQHFGLRICHHCVAPRFGKTCDKEVSGALHVRQLLQSIPEESVAAARLETLSDEMDRILEQHRKKQGGLR
jgi:hypothetical protein